MPVDKERKSKMTEEKKIEKVDATAEEIARAIFAAADDPIPQTCGDNDNERK